MTDLQWQKLLSLLGCDPGTLDGIFGKKSTAALKQFQKKAGIAQTGIRDNDTLVAAEAALADLLHGIKVEQPAPTPSQPVQKDKDGTFWDGIKYFTRAEFACHCGGKYCNGYPGEMSEKLVKIADTVREHFDAPATVSSGMRCSKHNAAVGGVSNSRHNPEVWNGEGKAMDFCIRGFSSSMVNAYCQQLVSAGRLRYAYCIDGSFVHMDVL